MGYLGNYAIILILFVMSVIVIRYTLTFITIYVKNKEPLKLKRFLYLISVGIVMSIVMINALLYEYNLLYTLKLTALGG